VALSGAHTMGSCHKTRSGFDGPWTHQPLKFDNSYFKNLLELKWQPRQWDGPLQYEDKQTGKLMMLPTDLALTTDRSFLSFVKAYAADETAFRAAFKAAFEKLLTLGCPAKCKPSAAANVPSKTAFASAGLRSQCMHGSIERAKALLTEGADPHSVEIDSGRGALHKAAFWGHDHIIPWLLTLKVDPNAPDAYGDTALHDAARFGHSNCVSQLLEGGADAMLKNKKGQTPADVAAAYGKAIPAGLHATSSWPALLSKAVLSFVCVFMIVVMDVPVLFLGAPAWEKSFTPTKRLPTGLTNKEEAIARAGAMFDHGFQLPLFLLALLCVHLGPASLRQLANAVLLFAIGLNGPYGISAWLGPHGYDAATLEVDVSAGKAVCTLLAVNLAIDFFA